MKKMFMFLIMGIGLFLGATVCYADNASEATLMDWASTINLSTLTEEKIYRYTAETNTSFPNIVNDTNKNLIIYLKELDAGYQQKVLLKKTIGTRSASLSTNSYQVGDAFNIFYKEATNEDLLGRIDASKMIKLSSYAEGTSLSYSGIEYIYNDTSKDIVLTIKTSASAAAKTETVPKNTIYGFDSSLASVVVGVVNETPTSPTEPEEEEESGNTGDTGNTGNGSNNNNEENEVEEEENPNTGVNVSILLIGGLVVIAALLLTFSDKNKVFNKI